MKQVEQMSSNLIKHITVAENQSITMCLSIITMLQQYYTYITIQPFILYRRPLLLIQFDCRAHTIR